MSLFILSHGSAFVKTLPKKKEQPKLLFLCICRLLFVCREDFVHDLVGAVVSVGLQKLPILRRIADIRHIHGFAVLQRGLECHDAETLGRSKAVTVLLAEGEALNPGYDVTVQPLSLQKIFVALCGEEARV